jgi:hypothetical protein
MGRAFLDESFDREVYDTGEARRPYPNPTRKPSYDPKISSMQPQPPPVTFNHSTGSLPFATACAACRFGESCPAHCLDCQLLRATKSRTPAYAMPPLSGNRHPLSWNLSELCERHQARLRGMQYPVNSSQRSRIPIRTGYDSYSSKWGRTRQQIVDPAEQWRQKHGFDPRILGANHFECMELEKAKRIEEQKLAQQNKNTPFHHNLGYLKTFKSQTGTWEPEFPVHKGTKSAYPIFCLQSNIYQAPVTSAPYTTWSQTNVPRPQTMEPQRQRYHSDRAGPSTINLTTTGPQFTAQSKSRSNFSGSRSFSNRAPSEHGHHNYKRGGGPPKRRGL